MILPTEFRLFITVKLPEDEFEAAAVMLKCAQIKAANQQLLTEQSLEGTVSHETFKPRGSREKEAEVIEPSHKSHFMPSARSNTTDRAVA
jgi:hypothetical protein